MAFSADLVTIGRVVKAHGIRGEVVVHLLSDVADRFAPGTLVRLGGRPMRIRTSRPHQGRQLVAFDGVTDRTDAERLRGLDIEGEPLDVEEHDTYFAHELVGLEVVGDDGRPLGTVSALIELPAAAGYDLLEVRRADRSTWLLPAADDLVQVVQVGGLGGADEVEDLGGPGGGDALAAASHASADQPRLQLRVVDPPAGLIDGEPLVAPTDGTPAVGSTAEPDVHDGHEDGMGRST